MCTILEIIPLINGGGVKEKRNIIFTKGLLSDVKAMAAGKVNYACIYPRLINRI